MLTQIRPDKMMSHAMDAKLVIRHPLAKKLQLHQIRLQLREQFTAVHLLLHIFLQSHSWIYAFNEV